MTATKGAPATLPPGTVLRLARLWPHARRRGREIGQEYLVGYYCRCCGRDVIWLVGLDGKYGWTADRAFIDRHFDVVALSKERSLFGRRLSRT